MCVCVSGVEEGRRGRDGGGGGWGVVAGGRLGPPPCQTVML